MTSELKITRQRRNKLQRIEIINTKREYGRLDTGYMPREMQSTGIPLKKPHKDYLIHVARNGNGVLKVKADPEFGMPFGRDPLTSLWLFSAAKENNSPIVTFDSPRQLLLNMGLPVDGYTYKWAVGSFERNFGATWEYTIEDNFLRGKVKDRRWLRLVDRAVLWYNTSPEQMALEGDDFKFRIELTPSAFEMAKKGALIELETVAALAPAPGPMRLFMILRERCARVAEGEHEWIGLTGEYGLDKQMGISQPYKDQHDWRKWLRRWLRSVAEWWPDCPTPDDIHQDRQGYFRLQIRHVDPPAGPSRRRLKG
jgi:hypothetical protein